MKAKLDCIENRIARLEQEATADCEPSSLLDVLTDIFEPATIDSLTAFERRGLWCSLQLFKILSRCKQQGIGLRQALYLEADIRKQMAKWALAVAQFEDGPWCPLQEVALHQLKYCVRLDAPLFDEFGVSKAEQISCVLSNLPWPYVSPWSAGFRYDRSTWPADIRSKVESLLIESDSIIPEMVAPFDLREITA